MDATQTDRSGEERSLPLRRLDTAVRRIGEYVDGRPPRGLAHDDADDTDGTIETDDAIGFDPRPLLAALAAHRVRAVVIGQVAGIMHGSTELTGDLDLLWSGSPADAPSVASRDSAFDQHTRRRVRDDRPR